MDRGGILASLRGAVAAATEFATVGNELVFWDQVAAQPALYSRYVRDTMIRNYSGLRGPSEIRAELWIYTRGEERSDRDYALALLDLLTAVDRALLRSPITRTQTLGGAVIDCWREGTETGYEPSGRQAVAVVDIAMLVDE